MLGPLLETQIVLFLSSLKQDDATRPSKVDFTLKLSKFPTQLLVIFYY